MSVITATTYVVKWTDVSQGYHFPCEKRDLTEEQADAIVAGYAERTRLYYTGVMAPMQPFQDVRKLVQCDCGRDVEQGAEHTIPYTHGERCTAFDAD